MMMIVLVKKEDKESRGGGWTSSFAQLFYASCLWRKSRVPKLDPIGI